MIEQQLIREEEISFEAKEKYVQKLKFCMISQSKTLSSKDRLAMFVMDNKF